MTRKNRSQWRNQQSGHLRFNCLDDLPALRSRKAFGVTALILTVVMLSLTLMIYNGYIAFPDEAVHNAQADALAHGSWSTSRPAPSFDKNGVYDPLGSSYINGAERVPYARNPLYSLFITPSYVVAGKLGLQMMAAIGGIVSSILIGLIARRFGEQFAIPSMLMTIAGTSLIFSSYITVAQTWAVAASAGIILTVFAAIHRWNRLAILIGALLSFILPQLRSEGAIFIGGMAIALTGVAVLSNGLGKSVRLRVLVISGILGAAGVCGYLFNASWARSITSIVSFDNSRYSDPSKAILGSDTSPLAAAWSALIKPWPSPLEASMPLTLVVLCVFVGALSFRIVSKSWLIPAALAVVAGIAAVAFLMTNYGYVPGLFAVSPLLMVGLIWFERSRFGTPEYLLLALSVPLITVGLLLTVYGDGGSAQWGGRLFQVLIPALVPLAVIGISRASKLIPRRAMMVVFVSLIVLSISLSASALRYNRIQREAHKEFNLSIIDTIEEVDEAYPRGEKQRLVFYSDSPMTGTARSLWEEDSVLDIVHVGFDDLLAVLSNWNSEQYHEVLVISNVISPAFDVLNRVLEEEHSIKVDEVRPDKMIAFNVYLYSGL